MKFWGWVLAGQDGWDSVCGRGQDVRGMPGLEYKRPDYTVSPEPKSVVLILEIVGIRDDPVWGIFF